MSSSKSLYPLVMTNSSLLKIAIKIVDLQYPLKMVMFHSFVNVYQRACSPTYYGICVQKPSIMLGKF